MEGNASHSGKASEMCQAAEVIYVAGASGAILPVDRLVDRYLDEILCYTITRIQVQTITVANLVAELMHALTTKSRAARRVMCRPGPKKLLMPFQDIEASLLKSQYRRCY